jgi:CheY-like chemotaxis protein
MTTIIVITGHPTWEQATTDALPADAKLIHYTEQPRYVARLADDLAAIILVDGERDDWRFWTVTPKSSPATRRIPIVVISDDAARREAALASGADRALSQLELLDQLSQLITELARVQSADAAAALRAGCDEPMPPEGVQAIAQFNAGEYYRQHDTFEAMWMAETHPIRDLYRAILQVGIAYYQITLGNWRGAHKMLLRSIQWLAPLPDVCQGVDIAQLRADAAAVRAELERVGEAGMAEFDKRLLRGVTMVVKS